MAPARSLALAAALILAGVTILPPLVVASETCVSHGIAYNCVTESVERVDADIPYQDGSHGGTPLNTTTNVFDSWPDNLTTPAGNSYVTLREGVQIGPVHELRATFYAPNSTTAAPGTQTVVRFGDAIPLSFMVPLWSERVRFQPTNIMNGASVFIWRSPFIWDAANWTGHSVVFRDADSNVILGGDTLIPGAGIDGGEGALIDGRIYHVIEMPLRSSHNWTVTEYAQVLPSVAGMSHFDISLSNGADMANDGNREGFFFPGTSAGFAFPADEAGWSAVFLRGIGAAGIERLVLGNSSLPWNEVGTRTLGSSGTNPNTVEITIPLRTSTPLDLEVQIRVLNHTGASIGGTHTAWLHGVTGIAIANLTITQTGESSFNQYDISYGWNLTTGNATTYLEYDNSAGLVKHTFYSCPSYSNLTTPPPLPIDTTCQAYFPMFTPWVEIHESTVASPPASGTVSDHSFHLSAFLIGVAQVEAGFGLQLLGGLLFVPPVTEIGVLFGAAAVAGGFALVAEGAVNIAYGTGLIGTSTYDQIQNTLAQLGKDALAVVATGACLLSLVAAPAILAGVTCILAAIADLWALGVPIFQIIKNALETVGYWLGVLLPYLVPIVATAVIFLLAPLVLSLPIGAVKWIVIAVLFLPACLFTAGRPKNWIPYSRAYHLDVPWFTGLIEKRLFKMSDI